MPLDDATLRLALVLQRDLRRLAERERVRADRGEEVRFDAATRIATWETRQGSVVGRWYAEPLATYTPHDRTLRWAWAGGATGKPASHATVVHREGIARGVPQLGTTEVPDLDGEEASTIARLAVLVARGDGITVAPGAGKTVFVGLFDSARPREGEAADPARYSVPPPPVAHVPAGSDVIPSLPRPPRLPSSPPVETPGAPPVSASRSLPPIREIYDPRNTSRPAESPLGGPLDGGQRRPPRATVLPLGAAALALLVKQAPGFRQALLVVSIEPKEKRRLYVSITALDGVGLLHAVDVSDAMMEAAIRLVEDDRAAGDVSWRRLSARIVPKPDGGATLHVDVV